MLKLAACSSYTVMKMVVVGSYCEHLAPFMCWTMFYTCAWTFIKKPKSIEVYHIPYSDKQYWTCRGYHSV